MLPIWEGTTNILSLDILRAIKKTNGEVIRVYVSHCQSILKASGKSEPAIKLENALDRLNRYMTEEFTASGDQDLLARELAFTLARIYIGINLKID